MTHKLQLPAHSGPAGPLVGPCRSVERRIDMPFKDCYALRIVKRPTMSHQHHNELLLSRQLLAQGERLAWEA